MSYLPPRIPDNAPFTPAQRAWLNGLLAALLSVEQPISMAGGPAVPATSSSPASTPVSEPEEFPWHDPALELDERLRLSESRPLARRLMSAMAQLDCGQCGYVCETYAAAIAEGRETSLSKCVPGGKATQRALKELLSTAESPTSGALGAVPRASPAPGAIILGRPATVSARFERAERLTRAGSAKDTRHVVLEIEDAVYEVGDSLGVHVSNCPDEVDRIIARLGGRPDEEVDCPDGTRRPLREALLTVCNIAQPTDLAIEVLGTRSKPGDSERLQALAEGYPGAEPVDADLLDLLLHFPSARPPIQELVSVLGILQPRLYSIASSPKLHPGNVHLTVAAVRYRKRGRNRKGVASTYLADRAVPGSTVPAFVQRARDFRLPKDPDTPVIMIGPGTGVAPFRAFLQERRAIGAKGRNWLFFGEQHRAFDFLFEEELLGYHRDGLLTRLDTAFSRDQEEKLYVQHRMREHAAELWSWLREGACIYVCGDAQRMARDVDAALSLIIAKQAGITLGEAKARLAAMAREYRYLRDVY